MHLHEENQNINHWFPDSSNSDEENGIYQITKIPQERELHQKVHLAEASRFLNIQLNPK